MTIFPLLLAALAFSDTKTLAVQICLDREGYSPNTIDGTWGAKSQRALARFCADAQMPLPPTPEAAHDALFAGTRAHLFRTDTVTTADLAALVTIPKEPAAKANLPQMGYESILEMYAERAHMSRRGLERLNPNVDFSRVTAGTRILLPDFPSVDEELAAWPRSSRKAPPRPDAALLRISLSRFEVAAYDKGGRLLALFPCSIAKDKSKRPKKRELKVVTRIPRPNYTFTPDNVRPGQKVSRHILPEGPNCPVGIAWMGLDLPGYGIHGTPFPERIGRAESHGCFRLANWNAARLYAICPIGTRVLIED